MVTPNERGVYTGIPNEETSDEEGERHAKKRLHVIRHGAEREIRLLMVVENFRFASYLTFILIIVLGIVLTKAYVKGDYEKPLRDVFGIVNLCVYYDYPPSSYVMPSLWSINLIFLYAYTITSVFRVWVAKEEKKVSQASFVIYVIGFVYVVLSFVGFSTIFAVQPNPAIPHTWIIHTVPYTNISIAMCALALLVTWFGEKIAWTDLGIHKLFFYFNRFMVVIQVVSVAAKLVHHINCLSKLETGLWWHPQQQEYEYVFTVFQVFDYLFLASVIGWPTLQSGFLTYKHHQTHCVYLSIHDNRMAAEEKQLLSGK